jgi:acetyl esterase
MRTTSFKSSVSAEPVTLQVFGKQATRHKLPVVIYFHGGFFNCGTIEESYPLANLLATEMIVVSVDYPLAPAMRFPDTIEVAFEALTWVISQAHMLGVDTKQIFVAGEQAGGNLAAVVAMLFRDRAMRFKSDVKLAGQVLINPMLDALQTSKSMGAATDCPCRRAWAEYIPATSDNIHPYASPANSCRLSGLAPALVITSHSDPLRDEAEQYAAKLLLAGVPVQVRRLDNGKINLTSPQHPSFEHTAQLIRHFMIDH